MKIDTYPALPSDFMLSSNLSLGQPAAMVTQPVIAQQFDEDSFVDSSGEILGNFVDSGQLWALLIGIVIGYVLRGITTY